MIRVNTMGIPLIILFLFFNVGTAQTSKKEIQFSEVLGMAHLYGKKKYNTFSGKWTFKNETTWLLLKNGWALKNPEEPISESAALKVDGFNDERWINWKEDERFSDIKVYKPSPKDATYDLSVKLYSVNGSPISIGVSKTIFILHKNGRFETSVFSLVEVSAGGSSTSVSESKDKSGTQRTSQGTGELGSKKVSTIGKNSAGGDGSMTGSYKINGHRIDLKFDSGVDNVFLFATDGQKNMILGRDFYFNK